MSGIQMALLNAGDGFLLGFDNFSDIELTVEASSGQPPIQVTYNIFTNATCTKVGSLPLDPNTGPTAWGTPTGGTPGNNYEARLVVTAVNVALGVGSYVRFAGSDVTGTTGWSALSSARTIDVYVTAGTSDITGTLEIRNASSLVTISRAFTLIADLNA